MLSLWLCRVATTTPTAMTASSIGSIGTKHCMMTQDMPASFAAWSTSGWSETMGWSSLQTMICTINYLPLCSRAVLNTFLQCCELLAGSFVAASSRVHKSTCANPCVSKKRNNSTFAMELSLLLLLAPVPVTPACSPTCLHAWIQLPQHHTPLQLSSAMCSCVESSALSSDGAVSWMVGP